MTRFLYLSDTHWGAESLGYSQQPGYPDRLPAIVQALAEAITAIGDVDFVLHGGDLLDRCDPARIAEAPALFALPVPVYLCLGNHDLTRPDALELWLDGAPQFFPGGGPACSIDTPDGRVHVLPNHWQARPYFWDPAEQTPHFDAEQCRWLAAALDRRPDLPHILCTHSPVHGLPPAQTGLPEPLHAPPPAFRAQVEELIAGRPQLACVLGAHSHLNLCLAVDGVHYVTTSSLVETPFEFKVIDLSTTAVSMRTAALQPRLAFRGDYVAERTWVQGRPGDRAFDWTR